MYTESDEELRKRITRKYGMPSFVWYLRGEALDNAARFVGIERIVAEVPGDCDETCN